MKKVYIKPDIDELVIEPLQIIAASTPDFSESDAWKDDALGKEHTPNVGFDAWDDWGADEEE